jgi:hypothetical protein
MAILYNAELTPSKIELVAEWAPTQPWFAGDAGDMMTTVASFRFDDPEGEVGVETLLVRAGDGPVMQVPLTYRGAPLAGAESSLIGTMKHSVLGDRWVYDAVGDPVYLLTVASAIVTAGREAELLVDVDGEQVRRDPTATVTGSGMPGVATPALPLADDVAVRAEGAMTIAETPALTVVVDRVPGAKPPHPHLLDGVAGTSGLLTGSWSGQPEARSLVTAVLR